LRKIDINFPKNSVQRENSHEYFIDSFSLLSDSRFLLSTILSVQTFEISFAGVTREGNKREGNEMKNSADSDPPFRQENLFFRGRKSHTCAYTYPQSFISFGCPCLFLYCFAQLTLNFKMESQKYHNIAFLRIKTSY
jgi:hypothetical protein